MSSFRQVLAIGIKGSFKPVANMMWKQGDDHYVHPHHKGAKAICRAPGSKVNVYLGHMEVAGVVRPVLYRVSRPGRLPKKLPII